MLWKSRVSSEFQVICSKHFPQNIHIRKLDEFCTVIAQSINVFGNILCTDIPILAKKQERRINKAIPLLANFNLIKFMAESGTKVLPL